MSLLSLPLLLMLLMLQLANQADAAVVRRSMNCLGPDRNSCVSFMISQMQDPFRMCASCLQGFYKETNMMAGLQVYVDCCTRLISLISSAVF